MSTWPLLSRRDIVGRRFLSVKRDPNDINGEPLDIRRGVIRASSHADPSAQDEKVLVEFDGSFDWTGRQWIAIYSQVDVFLVEDMLIGVMPHVGTPGIYQPVLTFKTMIDKIHYSNDLHLVESLTPDRTLDFVSDSSIVHLKEQDVQQMCDNAAAGDWTYARSWLSFQQSQNVLLSCPSRMINCRVRVYNIAGCNQWYSGRIIGSNENTKSVTILDDTGIEHVENAALIQMELDNKDFIVTLKDCSGVALKPRSRTSSEEHPVAKQPRLDASGTANDFPMNSSSSSTSQDAMRQLVTMTDASEYTSSTTRSLQGHPGSRNLFSAIMTPQPSDRESQMSGTPDVLAFTTNPLQILKPGAPVLPTSANTSVLATSRSPPLNQDSSKIKTLLGYRPSVTFFIPAPGPTSPGGTASVVPVPGNCPASAKVMGSPGNQKGASETTITGRLIQQNSGLQLPSGVEYIGSIQIKNPPHNPGIFPRGLMANEVPATVATIQGRGTSGETSNAEKQRNEQGLAAIHAFHGSVESEVQEQSMAKFQCATDTLSRNQLPQNPSRMPGVPSIRGQQQMQSPSRMPGVPSIRGQQQMQSPSRMPGVPSIRGQQQMQSPSRMPGVQSICEQQQILNPSQMPGVQSISEQQHMQNPSRMPGVQSISEQQHMQNPSRMPGVQSISEQQHMQNPSRMPGVQSISEQQQMQNPSRMQGVLNPSGLHQVQGPGRMPSMQGAVGVQQMQSPKRMQGGQSANGLQQMQSSSRMQGVQSPSRMQSPGRMQGVQSPSRMRGVQGPGRMQGVPNPDIQSQMRMPGVQSASVNQQNHVRVQNASENQQCAVRIMETQDTGASQQMPSPARFQGVQSASGNQQVQNPLQFQGVQSARGIQQTPRNPQVQVRSNASGIQQVSNSLNSGTGPPRQITRQRMPTVTRLLQMQGQGQATTLPKPNLVQHDRRQSLPESLQILSSVGGTQGLQMSAGMQRMQRPSVFRGQSSSATPRGPSSQARTSRPNNVGNVRQSVVGARSHVSSQEIVQQVVENALRKYGMKMNCRLNESVQRQNTASRTKCSVSSLSSPVESSGSLPRGSGLQAATSVTRQDGAGVLSRQNSGRLVASTEPSKSQDVSKAFDFNSKISQSSPKMATAFNAQYHAINSSSLVGSLGSSVPVQRNQTSGAQQESKVSKTDSCMVSTEILKGKRKGDQLGKAKKIHTKPQTASPQQQPASSSSMTASSLSKSETLTQSLDAISTLCKSDRVQTTRDVLSTSASAVTDSRLIATSPALARQPGDRLPKMWFEEYEDELKDLSRILDMLKHLDSTKCHQIQASTGSQANKTPKPKLLLEQTNKLAIPDTRHPPHNHHGVIKTPQQKSDCEMKIKQLQEQLLALGLKFENPSFALSKKKLNLVCNSPNGFRTYIQDKSCLSLPTLLLKCRECKSACSYPSKMSHVLCRFHAFRRLTLTSKRAYVSSGFSTPTDADAVDISLWMPLLPIVDPQIDVEMAKYIVKNVGNRFCELVEQEKEAMSWVASNGDVAWKRAVYGIREMCDVCNTTLFNVHWVCRKCGYVVCLDCYRTKTHKCTRCHDDINCATCDRGCLKWAKCTVVRQPHDPKEMMLTQIIPSDVLWVVGRMIHDVRKKWRISENCPCGEDRVFDLSEEPNMIDQVNRVTQSDDNLPVNDGNCCQGLGSVGSELGDCNKDAKDKLNSDSCKKTGSEVCLQSTDRTDVKLNSNNVKSQGPFTLREFLLAKNSVFDGVKLEKAPVSSSRNLDDVFRRVIKDKLSHVASQDSPRPSPDSSAVTDNVTSTPVGPNSSSLEEVPYVWLDNGRLLQLLEPRNPGNIRKFQEVWRKGQPVVISNCDRYITKDLWLPESFAKEFGDMENDLVDCSHKVILLGHQMRHFWEGFESVQKRLKDSQGQPMILKLKDWPPTEDFSEMLPSRFKDLLQGLPLPEYTDRMGVFNLASRLPEFFVRPDLGPKMYNAYGSALYPMVGSTNLHLDVSDAVNLILYVGIPLDDTEDHEAAAIQAMRKAGCCELTIARATEGGCKPGALWHIFDAKDSDKIRDLLTKVGVEVGEPVEPHHDPIHDQSWYLDETLRERLLREYSVQGYTLVQCIGDAVFIPAGAPHQVRNLHSCIKAAEDFVSPENLSHCFRMTQEFRHLSDTHSNHEDKLQVKNIIYHAVKDAIAVLQNHKPDST